MPGVPAGEGSPLMGRLLRQGRGVRQGMGRRVLRDLTGRPCKVVSSGGRFGGRLIYCGGRTYSDGA